MTDDDAPLIRWAEVSPEFGAGMPYGSCNAVVAEDDAGELICGYPRREDGTCHDGHPAQPWQPGDPIDYTHSDCMCRVGGMGRRTECPVHGAWRVIPPAETTGSEDPA